MWRHLEQNEALRFLFGPDGAVGREIADLEKVILGGGLRDHLVLTEKIHRRLGLLAVKDAVIALAAEEVAERERQETKQASATYRKPADSPIPRIF